MFDVFINVEYICVFSHVFVSIWIVEMNCIIYGVYSLYRKLELSERN